MSYSQEDLEKLLIGSILVDGDGIASGVIKLQDLKTEAAIESFNAACNLYSQRKPVNIQTVALETGIKYVNYLTDAFDNGLKTNLKPLSEELRARAIKARISAGMKRIEQSLRLAGPNEIINMVRDLYNSEIIVGSEQGTIEEAINSFEVKSAKYADQGNIGITTGFCKWDNALITYEPGHLWTIGGFTSVGKTATALEFAGRIGPNKGLAIFSLEMTKPQIISRMLSRLTGFSSRLILSGRLRNKLEVEAIARAKKHLLSQPLFIFRKARDWSQIVNTCRMLKMQGCLDVAIFDYFQNIKSTGSTKFEQSDNLSRGAQDLVQDLEITGIMLSQISQQQNRDDSGVAEYKGGGGQAEVTDIGLHLSRPKASKTELLVEMRKNRHGPRIDLLLEYQENYTRLEEKA